MSLITDLVRVLPEHRDSLIGKLYEYKERRSCDVPFVGTLYKLGIYDQKLAEERTQVAEATITYFQEFKFSDFDEGGVYRKEFNGKKDCRQMISELGEFILRNAQLTEDHNLTSHSIISAKSGELNGILEKYRTLFQGCIYDISSAIKKYEAQQAQEIKQDFAEVSRRLQDVLEKTEDMKRQLSQGHPIS